MKYAVTIRVERSTDVIVESDTDIDKLDEPAKRGILINNLERAAIHFYEDNMTNRKLVEEEIGVLGVSADFQGKAESKTLFIDASKECVKVTNSNKLTEENIGNILRVFTERREKIDYVSRLVDNDEIAVNEYNLSVSSYVEAEDTREAIDIQLLNARIAEIVAKENTLRAQIDRIIGEIEG